MMPDREKVIKGLECCQPPYDCHNCPYDWDHCFMKNQLHKDALDLLKEQDYRSWLMDMFHKYGRDDLIALLVLNGEENLLADVLKEHEAVEPTLIREGRNKNYNDYVCPRCGYEVVYEQNYCSECGVEFMWEGR